MQAPSPSSNPSTSLPAGLKPNSSSHRREPATDSNSFLHSTDNHNLHRTTSRNSQLSTRLTKKDSRGFHTAQAAQKFESALRDGRTKRLTSAGLADGGFGQLVGDEMMNAPFDPDGTKGELYRVSDQDEENEDGDEATKPQAPLRNPNHPSSVLRPSSKIGSSRSVSSRSTRPVQSRSTSAESTTHLGPKFQSKRGLSYTSDTASSSGNVSLAPPLENQAETSEERKRKGLFRAGGTASSPDLATLVRKTKQSLLAATLQPNTTTSHPVPPSTDHLHPPSRLNRSISDAPPRFQPSTYMSSHLPLPSALSDRSLEDWDRVQSPVSSFEPTPAPTPPSTSRSNLLRNFHSGSSVNVGGVQFKPNGGVEHLKPAQPPGFGDKESKSLRLKARNAFSKLFSPSVSQPIVQQPPPQDRPTRTPDGSAYRSDPSIRPSTPPVSFPSSKDAPDPQSITPFSDPSSTNPSPAVPHTHRSPSDPPPLPLASLITTPPRPPGPPQSIRTPQRRTTEPSTTSSGLTTPTADEMIISQLGLLPPDQSSLPRRLSGRSRRRSLSVGGISGTEEWECHLEGLLDGIAEKGGQPSPLKSKDVNLPTTTAAKQPAANRSSIDSGGSFKSATHSPSRSVFEEQFPDGQDPMVSEKVGSRKRLSVGEIFSLGGATGPLFTLHKRSASYGSGGSCPEGDPSSALSTKTTSVEGESPPPATGPRRSSADYKKVEGKKERRPSVVLEMASIPQTPTSHLSSQTSLDQMRPLPVLPNPFVIPGEPASLPRSPLEKTVHSESSSSYLGAVPPSEDLTAKLGKPIAPSRTSWDHTSTSGIGLDPHQKTIRLVTSSPSLGLPRLPNTSPLPTVSKLIAATASSSSIEGIPRDQGSGSAWEGVGLGLEVGERAHGSVGRGLGLDGADGGEDKIKGSKGENEMEEAREAVERILNKDPTFKWVQTNRVAEFLGERDSVNAAAVVLYMASFDFSGMKLDRAIRKLTSELYFKAETQELDRIIVAFCERYIECNSNTLFRSVGVLHQVAYSLLLLNTDLHVADQDRKMTRNQFVENTMGSIRSDLSSAGQSRTSLRSSTPDLPSEGSAPSVRAYDVFQDLSAASDHLSRSSWSRSGSISFSGIVPAAFESRPMSPPDMVHKPTSQTTIGSTTMTFGSGLSSPLIGTPAGSISHDLRTRPGLGVPNKSWLGEMELTLKDLYNSVKSQEIIQPIESSSVVARSTASSGSLSRHRSVRSQSSPGDRLNTLKRGSVRGISALSGAMGSLGSYNSVSSGRLSPTPSTSLSLAESQAESNPYTAPAMGFASNLTHTIIKENDGESIHSTVSVSTIDDLIDEELALLGSPWAKEGMVTKKSLMEPGAKRSKDKTWKSLFAVVQKGSLRMFTFPSSGGSSGGGVFGGGNWLSNANLVDEVTLLHCVAKILPPPGYNRSRPHVFTLELPSGAQTFFQVGTDTLADEWVSTCNYWAARTSKEPLTGGVSNMDYGWGGPSFNENETESVFSTKRRIRHTTPHVNEWKPPSQPLYPSRHDEESQLDALRRYTVKLEEEIQEHLAAETNLLPARHMHGTKALDNYRRKAKFLEDERFKYNIYISALEHGLIARVSKKGEIRLNHTLEKAARPTSSDLRVPEPTYRTSALLETDEQTEDGCRSS